MFPVLVHLSCDQSSAAPCNYCSQLGHWVTAWNHRSFSERCLLCPIHLQQLYYLPFTLKCGCGRAIFGKRGPNTSNVPWIGYPLINTSPNGMISCNMISSTPASQVIVAPPPPVLPPVGDLLPPAYTSSNMVSTMASTSTITTTITATSSTTLRSLLATPPTTVPITPASPAVYSCIRFPNDTRPTMSTTNFVMPEPATPIRLAPATTAPIATAAVFRRNLEDRSRSPLFAHVDRSSDSTRRIKREPM